MEVSGLVIVLVAGLIQIGQGDARWGTLVEFKADGNPVLAVVAGVALGFFAMTGFENAANVAEETVEPHRTFPRALVAGMAGAGLFYVAVAIAAALTVPFGTTRTWDSGVAVAVQAPSPMAPAIIR